MKRSLQRSLIVGAGMALVFAGAAFLRAVFLPYAGFEESQTIRIERGDRTHTIAARLEVRGIVPHRWLFLALRALRHADRLQAGEYRFDEPLSPWQVFDKIAHGDVVLHPFTVPEGYTRFEIARAFENAGFGTAGDFLEETASPSRVQALFPEAETLEGCLFPETYQLTWPFSTEELVDAMAENFHKVFDAERRPSRSPLDPWEALILASLVEKETGVAEERPLISSVFHNRLRENMLLQCDPTIIYGLLVEDRYRGAIHQSDIRDPHRYNTYVHPGLPPGPIANPGRAAMRAAFQPAESDYFYFVAKPGSDGEHVFSDTLQAHNRAVQAYRQGRR